LCGLHHKSQGTTAKTSPLLGEMRGDLVLRESVRNRSEDRQRAGGRRPICALDFWEKSNASLVHVNKDQKRKENES